MPPHLEALPLDIADATVFVVDDDPQVCTTLTSLLASAGLATQTYFSALEFLDHYDASTLGCLLLDVHLPRMSGLELQQELRNRGHDIPVIFITGYVELDSITQAMRNGALDVIEKPFKLGQLLKCVRHALALGSELIRKRKVVVEVSERLQRLTEREQEIMYQLAAGDSAKVIAHRLSISSKTVDNHRIKILEKMDVENPTQLALTLALLK